MLGGSVLVVHGPVATVALVTADEGVLAELGKAVYHLLEGPVGDLILWKGPR